MPPFSDRELQRMRGNQMDRGAGFAEQGGYQGQVYNTPIEQQLPRPVPQPRPPAVMPQGTPVQPNPYKPRIHPYRPNMGQGQGTMRKLSPEEIQMYNRYMQEQELRRAYQQERFKGVLGGE